MLQSLEEEEEIIVFFITKIMVEEIITCLGVQGYLYNLECT